MLYGEGRTDEGPAKPQAAYTATDDEATYEVTTANGTTFTVFGINSARTVAGTDGRYRRINDPQ